MKNIIFLLIMFPIHVLAQDGIGSNEHLLYQRFQSEQSCKESTEAVKYCLKNNMAVAGCRKDKAKDFNSFCEMSGQSVPGCENRQPGETTYQAIIQCGGSLTLSSDCKKVLTDTHYDVGYYNSICRKYISSNEEFNSAVACLPGDLKERVIKSCPKGCAEKPKVIICDWTRQEWQTYKNCEDSMMVHILRKGCPEGNIDLHPELGNPPRISVSGKVIIGKDGTSLTSTFSSDVKLNIRYLRGKTGSFCVFPRGKQCNTTPVSVPVKPYHASGHPINEAPGEYTVEVTSGNGLKATRNFTIAGPQSHGKNFEYCRMRTGFACTKDKKEVELFYLCGEKPSGTGWMGSDEDGKYFRYTSQSCIKPGTDSYRYIDATTSDSNENYVTNVAYEWKVFDDPWYREKHNLEAIHPASYFKGKACSAGQTSRLEKDLDANMWICSKTTVVEKVAAVVKPKSTQCLYYDYKDTTGKKIEAYLEEGTQTVRSIIKDNNLVVQKIICLNGQLADVDQMAQANKCMYENHLSLDGKKQISYIDNNVTVMRQINVNGKLQMQTIRCRNGELQDVQQLNSDVRQSLPCTVYDYTSVDGKYDSLILKPHKTLTRRIIVEENGHRILKKQTVKCSLGVLGEVK